MLLALPLQLPSQTSSTPRRIKQRDLLTTSLFAPLQIMKDHAAALQTIDKHCSDLDLTLKPCECVSFVYDGKKVLSNTFPLRDGFTRKISSARSH